MNGSFYIGNVPVSNISQDEIIQSIGAAINLNQWCLITYINAYSVELAKKNKEYRNAIEAFNILFPDGTGVNLAANIFSNSFKERFNATDFHHQVLNYADHNRLKVYFLGSRESTHQILSTKLNSLIVVGMNNGYDNIVDSVKVICNINNAKPDILFIALGIPKQEIWVAEHAKMLNVPVIICVGNFFEFLAGTIPRAPIWMRKIGLEWFHRLLLEPRRLYKRYLFGIPKFLWIVFKQKFSTL